MWVETLGQGKGIVGYQNKFGIPDLNVKNFYKERVSPGLPVVPSHDPEGLRGRAL